MVLRVKITILGDPNVGKTSLISKYCKNEFPTKYRATLGADFTNKSIKYKGNNFDLVLWDIAGTTTFEIEQMSDFYLQGSNGYLLVFDLTSSKTLKNLSFWYDKAVRVCNDIPFKVVGNKNDLVDFFEIFEKDIEAYIQKNKLTGFVRTSANSGENVEKVILSLLEEILIKERKK